MLGLLKHLQFSWFFKYFFTFKNRLFSGWIDELVTKSTFLRRPKRKSQLIGLPGQVPPIIKSSPKNGFTNSQLLKKCILRKQALKSNAERNHKGCSQYNYLNNFQALQKNALRVKLQPTRNWKIQFRSRQRKTHLMSWFLAAAVG